MDTLVAIIETDHNMNKWYKIGVLHSSWPASRRVGSKDNFHICGLKTRLKTSSYKLPCYKTYIKHISSLCSDLKSPKSSENTHLFNVSNGQKYFHTSICKLTKSHFSPYRCKSSWMHWTPCNLILSPRCLLRLHVSSSRRSASSVRGWFCWRERLVTGRGTSGTNRGEGDAYVLHSFLTTFCMNFRSPVKVSVHLSSVFSEAFGGGWFKRFRYAVNNNGFQNRV